MAELLVHLIGRFNLALTLIGQYLCWPSFFASGRLKW